MSVWVRLMADAACRLRPNACIVLYPMNQDKDEFFLVSEYLDVRNSTLFERAARLFGDEA